MAVTQNSYVGDGSTTTYSFTFPYLKKSEIKASLDATVTTAFDTPTATTVQFNTAPASGVKIKIYRETDSDSLTATFYAGSAIKSEDLNDNFTQNLYATQEVTARYLSNLGGTMVGDLQLGEDVVIKFEGATDNDYETILTVTDPTADRTITLPNETGTVITTASTGQVATSMIAADAVTGAKIADDQINSEHYVDGSIDTAHIADLQVTTDKLASNAVTTVKILDANVTTAKIADANVTTAKIAADAITGAKIADDQINSEHYVAASIDTEHIADSQVTTAKIADDAVSAAKLANTAVTAGSYTAADITVDAQGRITSAASGAIATSEITDSAVTTAKIADANVTTAKIADANVTTAKLAADAIDATKIADNAVTTDHIQDAELTTLAGMPSGTASILASSTALTSTTTELNQLDGKTLGETTLSTNSDTAIPTSKAVNDRILTVTNALGGFVAIANETSFPATHPDPSDGAGTVVSVSDAGGVVVNGSGVASITNGAGSGNTVTINGFPSSLYSKTLGAGIGLQVQTTTTLHTYDYHKILAKEADVEQLSGDINDFNERYRVAGSAPGSNNDDGDLWFDTSANKMKVYNATTSEWDDVASVGNFYINTISSSSGTGGGSATFNGSAYRFTLSNPPTMAQQLIVSVNGVIQKPDAGSSQPSEGFAISGNDIIFSAAPASGSDYFIVTQGSSVSIGTPSDNTVSTAKIQNQAVTTAKITDANVTTDKLADANVTNAKIADDTIAEAKLDVHNTPATGKYLKYTSNGMEWADGASEGTDVKSTGESGTAKFLRVDGDGTCSWQVPPDNDTVYTHPNHSGEVTSTGDGATVIASDVVDEDNLKISNAGTNGQYLQKQSGNTGGLTWADVDTGGEVVRQAQYTSSGSYTVPSGVTTIRAYAVGAGGNGGIAANGEYNQTSGAGGGMAYGDFTVVPGQTVTITISSRTATVAYGGTTLLTGSPGAHATDNGSSQATAGTATKHSSVTNGGAYSGGAGGYIATGGGGPGGASAGSPLGNGSRANHSGGAGIGTVGVWTSVSGGGAGSGSSGSGTHYVSGGSGPDCRGRDGARYALYTDPLIKHCVMPGDPGHIGFNVSNAHNYYHEAATGVGGYIQQSISPYTFWQFGNGGSFAGGAGGGINTGNSSNISAGDGGILGGGGAAGGSTGEYWAGHGGYGGGGGASKYDTGGSVTRGNGGDAVVWIFHA